MVFFINLRTPCLVSMATLRFSPFYVSQKGEVGRLIQNDLIIFIRLFLSYHFDYNIDLLLKHSSNPRFNDDNSITVL